jgi:hypothetical protein
MEEDINSNHAYILRISRDDLERQLYLRRSLYVGIRRDWSYGSKVLFVRKAGTADVFTGSGTIDRIVTVDELDKQERKTCLENNWYGKIFFSRLAKFHPPVMMQDTPASGINPLTLHGSTISPEEIARIEALARTKIMT